MFRTCNHGDNPISHNIDYATTRWRRVRVWRGRLVVAKAFE